jgi:hypothetical protein
MRSAVDVLEPALDAMAYPPLPGEVFAASAAAFLELDG